MEGVDLPEKIKGAARWLISEIIQETIDTEIEGITKVLAIDRAKDFYLKIGSQENPEYPQELILTKEAALSFLPEVLNVKKYLIKIAQNVLKSQLICLLKYI